jgi:hypothetical protein
MLTLKGLPMKCGLVVLALAACALAGCSTSTGILPAGPDIYTITERYEAGVDAAQRDVLTKVDDFCTQKGRKFVPVTMGPALDPVNPHRAMAGYTATFKCLLPNDPAVAAYQLQQAPNIIVEQRNR